MPNDLFLLVDLNKKVDEDYVGTHIITITYIYYVACHQYLSNGTVNSGECGYKKLRCITNIGIYTVQQLDPAILPTNSRPSQLFI